MAFGVDEAIALVRVGAIFADRLRDEEERAGSFRRAEGKLGRQKPSSGEPAILDQIADYRIDVTRARDEIRVRFTPRGEVARYLKDGTVEYLVRRGEAPQLVEPTG